MKALFDRFRLIRAASAEQIEKWADELILVLRQTAQEEAKLVEKYVNQVRRLNPDFDPLDLAQRIVRRRSLKAGGLGFIFNLGGVITMPVTLPANLYYSFRVQARMVLSVAYIYGWDIEDDDVITDMLLVMGGASGMQAAKSAGIEIGKEFAKKAVNKYITRDVMKAINKVLSRKIITKAGEKSLVTFGELVPLVGGPIGGAVDYLGARGIGKAAISFYST